MPCGKNFVEPSFEIVPLPSASATSSSTMLFKIVVLLAALGSAHGFAVMPAARSTPMRSSVSPKMQFGFFGGGGGAKEEKTVHELLSLFSMTDYCLLSSLAWRKSHTIPLHLSFAG